MSWASIVKRSTTNPSSSSSSSSSSSIQLPAPTLVPALVPLQVPVLPLVQKYQRHEAIANEDEANTKPRHWQIQRPNPKTCSPFITDEARWDWEHSEYVEDRKYSGEIHALRLAAWREKNNWHLPPNKQDVTDFDKSIGFFKTSSLDVPVGYMIPHCYDRDINGEANENNALTDLMWCLLHSRSGELAGCATVRDFKALFNSVIKLEFPYYNAESKSRHGLHRIISPEKILWLFSQKANVFPGYRRRGTPRWTKRPDAYPRDASYTKNMVFGIGEGGRDDAGICSVTQMKTGGDDAKIRWLLSAKQMREMQRVALVPEADYFEHRDIGWSSDGDW